MTDTVHGTIYTICEGKQPKRTDTQIKHPRNAKRGMAYVFSDCTAPVAHKRIPWGILDKEYTGTAQCVDRSKIWPLANVGSGIRRVGGAFGKSTTLVWDNYPNCVAQGFHRHHGKCLLLAPKTLWDMHLLHLRRAVSCMQWCSIRTVLVGQGSTTGSSSFGAGAQLELTWGISGTQLGLHWGCTTKTVWVVYHLGTTSAQGHGSEK